MLTSYKGRTVEQGQRVACFWNLHQNVFSLESKGLVSSHGNNFAMVNVKFTVQQAGRKKVLEERRKNVHAYVRGEFLGEEKSIDPDMREAYYNPFKQDCFTDKETGEKLVSASLVILKDKKVFYK